MPIPLKEVKPYVFRFRPGNYETLVGVNTILDRLKLVKIELTARGYEIIEVRDIYRPDYHPIFCVMVSYYSQKHKKVDHRSIITDGERWATMKGIPYESGLRADWEAWLVARMKKELDLTIGDQKLIQRAISEYFGAIHED